MRKYNTVFALSTATLAIAFDGAGWKKDAEGKIVTNDAGDPILVGSDGKEMVVGHGTVARLNGENRDLRQRAEAAETAAKAFEGLDATAARTVLDTLSKIDQKKLIDAGEVDRVRAEIGDQYKAQLTEKDTALALINSQMDEMRLDALFNSSKYIDENIAIPRDMFRAAFGKNFKIEDGKPVAYDHAGNKLMSQKNVGEYASPEEAFELIVGNYAQKDAILKAPDQRGSGGSAGGGKSGTGRTVRRSDFELLPPLKQAEVAQQARKGDVTIVD